MEGYWLISYIALWAVILLLALVVLAHSRLLGLLHHRLAPSAAKPLADGPEIGTKIRELNGQALQGLKWSLKFPAEKPVLLMFISPLCELCNSLAPHATDFAAAHRDVTLILLSTLDDLGMNKAFVQYRKLERLAYYVAPDLAAELSISGTPYAAFIGSDGTVLRKGLVNHYEHLRSLVVPGPQAPEPPIDFALETANAEVPDHV
jgi:methylamine dehydrogenase accessory protein MauD